MRAAALQPVDGSSHSLPKALRSGSCTALTLDQAMADRLGIGTWHYRAEADRVIVTGCLAMHLLGVEAAELPLAALLDRLDAANAGRLAAALRTAVPIDSITFESLGHTAGHAWFRLLGSDGASGFVQRLAGSGREPGTTDNRQRLRLALEASLARAAASARASTVLLLVKIEQLALLEQSRAEGPSLADTVIERLERLPHAYAGYRLESDIIAFLFDDEPGGTDESPGDARLRASDCVRRARIALRAPVGLAGRDYVLTTTIGAAACPRRQPVSAETLWQRAEVALAYAQKQHRRGRHIVFTRRIAAELADRLTLENELRQALARDEFELRYQPIVTLEHRRVSGLEVLMRWQHPTRGFVPPDIFIPLAEQLGLVQPLTEWLLRTAAGELASHLEAAPHLRVNINLSARQATPTLVGALLRQFADGGALTPARVTFEVTEGALLENEAPALEALNELKGKGCRIALDDFGTGFSSISYLEQFPIDAIKIDKGFVRRIGKSAESRKLVEAMLFMAGALELDCVAEGVEDVEELAFLAAKGCRHVQGFLFSKPLAATELEAFLDRFRFPEEALTEALWPKARGLPRLLSDNQEEALKLFVKHVPLAVAMFDSDMRYLAASDRWIRDYGIDEESLVGRCHYEVLPETPQKWRDGHARVMASGLVERSAVDSYRHASGRIDWLRWEVRPFHNSFGDVAGLIIFSEFITDRVEAETLRRDSEAKLADYLATASDWFWETDADHRIVYDSSLATSASEAMEQPSGGHSPHGMTHWQLAGIRKPADHEAWQGHLADLAARRPFRDFRYSQTSADGRISHLEISGKPVFDARGEFKGYRGTGRTITARVEAEQALIRQSEQLAFAGQLAGVGYWRTDLRRHTVDWSSEIYNIIGRTPAAFTPDIANRFDIFHPDDRRPAMTAVLEAAESGSDLHYEARVRRPDGSIRFIVCHGRPELEKSGRLKGFFGIFQDITEHRRAAVAAAHQAEQLALAGEIAGIGYWTHDSTTDTTFRSDEIQRITGRPTAARSTAAAGPSSAILHSEDLHPDDRAAHATAWRQALATGADLEDRRRVVRPDGTVRHVLIKARGRQDAAGRTIGYFGIVHDITEQIETAATIAARNRENELYRAMIDILPDFIFAKDKAGRFLAANAATATLMGASRPAELIGRTDHDFYEPAIADRFRADEEAFMARGETVILEQPGRRIDGSAGFLCSLKAPMRDAQGRLTGYVGHGRDITEEKRAQAALVESEAHFRQLVDGSLQALVIEQDEMVVFANDRFARLLGYLGSTQAIADATARYNRQPRATRQILARLGERFARGETIEAATRLDLARVDGERITVDCLACSIAWQGRPALQYTMIDVTRQVRYEAELEAEKTRLAAQADEMTRLAAALARSKLEAEAARDMLNDATAVLSDGFALFDAKSRIISCNSAFAALHGCPAEELVGSSIGDCVAQLSRHGPHPPDSEAARQVIEARLRAHYRADGTPFEMQLGNRWFVIRENRTVNGMTTLVRSEITHLKQIQDELERLATIDVLTELANRRHFVDQATRLLARCRDETTPAALLMFDIDRFKLINDRHGHATGDQALCRMGTLCREQLRPTDLVARWGGEEFVALLPRLTLDDATLVADRLRRTVAGTLIRTSGADVGFTISIGLVGCGPGETLEALINRADAALYDAKLQGRDRVVVDPSVGMPPVTLGATTVA
jgi:diguanylate cyclase (GGDEF)-like protein/PAS domain S-box-containing protein